MGNKGMGKESWWCMKKNLIMIRMSSFVLINVSDCFWVNLFNVVISRLNVSVFIIVFGKLKCGLVLWVMFVGKKCMVRINVMIFNGILIRNSYFYDEMDKIVVVIVGFVVEEIVMIKELIFMFCFR